jgi:hypothetical protein
MKKIYNTIEVIAESLICIFTFILIVWLLSLFDCLSGKQYEIILTFLGVIATFVVINNFRQAQESKELAKKEIEEIKKNAQKQIEELVATQKLMSDFVLTSKEYIVANKIIQQNNLPCNERAIWYLEYESNRNGYGFEKVEVKIKSVSLNENGDLMLVFMNEENNELSWLEGKKYISIGEETLNIDNLECRFDNQNFYNWLLLLLKTKED